MCVCVCVCVNLFELQTLCLFGGGVEVAEGSEEVAPHKRSHNEKEHIPQPEIHKHGAEAERQSVRAELLRA